MFIYEVYITDFEFVIKTFNRVLSNKLYIMFHISDNSIDFKIEKI